MEIPDEIRKCVAFFCWRSNPDRDPEPHATAFFVAKNVPNAKHTVVYAVTAGHALDKVKGSECADATPYLRINIRNDRPKLIEVPLQHWFCDPDDSVDLAVACVQLPDNRDHQSFPVESFAGPQIIQQHSIGVGDDVFLAGLFSEHAGEQRNIPIVRVGNISAMPEEKVNTRYCGPMEAYLVESRSIGGLSGSPVFVWLDQDTVNRRNQIIPRVVWTTQEEDPPPYQKSAVFYLLGIMHGHWDLPASISAIEDSMNRAMNMGIAIVVPAEKLRKLLDSEGFRKHRDSLHLAEENLPHSD